jgi:hypothetical protein
MAAAIANQEARQLMLDRRYGDELAESSDAAMKSIHKLRETLFPIAVEGKRIYNKAVEWAADAASWFLGGPESDKMEDYAELTGEKPATWKNLGSLGARAGAASLTGTGAILFVMYEGLRMLHFIRENTDPKAAQARLISPIG